MLNFGIKIILIFACFLGLFPLNLSSQTEVLPAGSLNLLTGFGFKSSASYYATNGNNVIELIDTNLKENNIYTFDLKNFIFDLALRYSLTDELQIQFELPLNYSKLNEIYLRDTNISSTSFGERKTKAELSYFLLENYQFKVLYHILKGKVNTFLTAGINIPQNFQNGRQNDGEFLYYSSFQYPVGLSTNLKLNGDWIEASITYFFRTGDFSDEMKFHLEGGFTSVPDTKLKGVIEYLLNIKPINENTVFNIRENPFTENALLIGAEFFINLHKKIETSISYNVSVLGKNSWSYGIFGLRANFLL